MNDLTFFIYLANVIPNVQPLFVIVALVLMTITGVKTFLWNEANRYRDELPFRFVGASYSVIAVLLIFLAVLIPSSNTIYMMAASEIGETVAKTPEAQQVMNDLRQIISNLAQGK